MGIVELKDAEGKIVKHNDYHIIKKNDGFSPRDASVGTLDVLGSKV